MGNNCEDLEDYLKAFELTLSVLQTEDALYRAAYELAEDAAKRRLVHGSALCTAASYSAGLTAACHLQAVLEGMADAQEILVFNRV